MKAAIVNGVVQALPIPDDGRRLWEVAKLELSILGGAEYRRYALQRVRLVVPVEIYMENAPISRDPSFDNEFLNRPEVQTAIRVALALKEGKW